MGIRSPPRPTQFPLAQAPFACGRSPLGEVPLFGYRRVVTDFDEPSGSDAPPAGRGALMLLGGGGIALLLAGILLWWREGSRLFTDGLIAAIVACF